MQIMNPNRTQAERDSKIKYEKNHITRIQLKFNNNNDDDMILLDYLKKQKNVTGYIKELIKSDIKKN